MKAILYEKLKEYAQSNQYPFHMPGHKGGREGIFPEVAQMDITEIDGFDNLHQPEGILAKAQELCAKTFGAEQSYFLINGSTAGILAAILGSCGDGEKILLARNCHKSVYSAVILSGAKAEYILPEYFTEMDFYGGVTVESCEKALSLHPDAKALVITSPSYEGFTSDIANIAEVVHKKGTILIVDEAHGSHMKFHPYFPKTALEQGADIVIQSLHKTLPSFTQTAVMHIQGDTVDRTRLQQALSMVQSTSPSYLFLASIDSCRSWLDGQEGKEAFDKYVRQLQEFRSTMAGNQSILLLGKEVCATHGVADMDLGKLIFYIPQGQVTGVELGKLLRQRFGLQMELCGNTHIIAMTSPADDEEGFLRLQQAILHLEKEISEMPISTIDFSGKMRQDIPVAKYTPRQGYFAQKKEVFLEESIGNICGEFVIPYPPGAPLLVPGEVITEEMVKKMQACRKNGICFIGCEDSSLQKIRIISL